MINSVRLFMITLVFLPCFAHDNVTQLFSDKDLLLYKESADTWLSDYASQLNPKELQLVANTLYLSHQFGLIDSTVRTQAKVLLQLSSHAYIRAMASQYDNKVTEYLTPLANNFNISCQLHQSVLLEWKACIDYVDTFKDSQLEKTISSFQDNVIEAMAMYMHTHAQDLNEIFISNVEVIKDGDATLNEITQAYKQLIQAQGKTSNRYEHNYIHLDLATKLASEITRVAQNLVETTEPVFEYANKLQIIGSTLCNLYYSTLYTWMQEHNQQPMVLFNEHGFIEEEQRNTPLPIIQ
ncbi:MAG TPA: hypothetical protein VFF04_00445 [Candidatus Babeliales bacterium]|nr:hypothetical protein [Candidatus Babeliales bacterium]